MPQIDRFTGDFMVVELDFDGDFMGNHNYGKSPRLMGTPQILQFYHCISEHNITMGKVT